MEIIDRIDTILERHRGRIVLALFVLALLVRITHVLGTAGNEPLPRDDQRSYDSFALAVIDGDWFLTDVSFREPVYPLVLSVAYRMSDQRFLAGRMLNALLGAMTVVVLFLLCESVFGRVVGVFSAAWYVFYFHSVFYTSFIQREVILALLLTTLFLLLVRMQQKPGRWRVVVTSLWYVLLVHADARYLFYAPFIALFILIMAPSFRSALSRGVLFFIVFFVAMVPWQVRNYVVYHEFVLVNTRTLSVQLPWISGQAGVSQKKLEEMPDNDPRKGEIRKLNGWRREAYDFAELYRIFRFHSEVRPGSWRVEEVWSPLHNWSSIVMYGALLPFFLLGMWLVIRHRKRDAYLFIIVIVTHTVLHLVMWGRVRYRVPIEPVIIMLAFYAIYWLVTRRSEPEAGQHV